MTFSADTPYDFRPQARRSLLRDVMLVLTAAGLATGAVASLAQLSRAPSPKVASDLAPLAGPAAQTPNPSRASTALSRIALATAERAAYPFSLSAPLRAGFQRLETALRTDVTPRESTVALAPVSGATAPALVGPMIPESRQADLLAPLPVPRPAELAARITVARRTTPATEAPAPLAPAPAKKPGLFERLFGSSEPSGPALAYANPQDGLGVPKSLVPMAPVSADRATAIYDISARTVTLPDGTRLEAHSGLREFLDDPRQVHVKMKGATPPAIYDLTLREKLFHGVEALRLTPVSGSVFGRVGLLAHTYMLGPNGDSNGCVSFRDYEAFLQAFKRGQVTRLMVVARAG